MLLQYQPQYTKWTTRELQAFIHTRTRGKVEAPQRRYDCVDTLRRLDEEPEFENFADLAPELRIEIYKLVLTHNVELGLVAYPEILRVSKMIHHEASDVLYTESRLVITCHLAIDTRPVLDWVRQMGRYRHSPLQLHKCLSPSVAHETWVNKIRLVRDLHLELGFYVWRNSGTFRLAQIFLAHVVQGCKDLRHLKISCQVNLYPGVVLGEAAVVEALWPLGDLVESCALEFHGINVEGKRVLNAANATIPKALVSGDV